MSLVGPLRARSNASDWEGLSKCLGTKFPGQKRIALTLLEQNLDTVVNESEEET